MSNNKPEEPWVKVPTKLLLMLKGEPLRIWMLIRSAAPGFAITMQHLTKQTGYTERQMRRLLAELTTAGLLRTTSKRTKNGRLCNTYRALMPDEQASPEKN